MAKRNLAKLVRRFITDKKGHRRSVWVKPSDKEKPKKYLVIKMNNEGKHIGKEHFDTKEEVINWMDKNKVPKVKVQSTTESGKAKMEIFKFDKKDEKYEQLSQ